LRVKAVRDKHSSSFKISEFFNQHELSLIYPKCSKLILLLLILLNTWKQQLKNFYNFNSSWYKLSQFKSDLIDTDRELYKGINSSFELKKNIFKLINLFLNVSLNLFKSPGLNCAVKPCVVTCSWKMNKNGSIKNPNMFLSISITCQIILFDEKMK